MRRIPLALALVGAVAVTGCMGGAKSSTTNDSGVQKGVTGSYFYINVFTPPVGGIVESTPAGIKCGASKLNVVGDQYSPVYYSGASTCGQMQVQWGVAPDVAEVTLTATAQGSNVFIGWAGDCSGTAPTCTVTQGADKTVVAIFGPAGSGHGMPFVGHGAVFGQSLAGDTAVPNCKACHGPNLQGLGMAPSCASCHATIDVSPSGPHGDATAAPWGEHLPSGWSQACQRCHTSDGYKDWVGNDGSANYLTDPFDGLVTATVNTNAGGYATGPLTCSTCHNPTSEPTGTGLTTIVFPSNKRVTADKATAICGQCHGARESSSTIETKIATYAPATDDSLLAAAGVSFMNPHYLGAAATMFGSEAAGWVQYPGKVYTARNQHGVIAGSCVSCHDPHGLGVNVTTTSCGRCHFNEVTGLPVANLIELEESRQFGFDAVDVDGDTLVESLKDEIAGLAAVVNERMQAYTNLVVKPAASVTYGICYQENYPYFNQDTDSSGACEATETTAFKMFTPRLMRAAVNLKWSHTESNAWAHNPRYAIEVLYDTIMDLDAAVVAAGGTSIDFQGYRSFEGHFGGVHTSTHLQPVDHTGSEAFHDWDPGPVGTACAQCHGGQKGIEKYLGLALPAAMPATPEITPVTGFECTTCHAPAAGDTNFKTMRSVAAVYFPPQKAAAKSVAKVAADFEKASDMVCSTCHSGRENGTSVQDKTCLPAGDPACVDVATWTVGFTNPHYLGAAGILFGTDAKVMYQYAGKTYSGKSIFWGSPHGSPHGASCTGCHKPQASKHSFEVDLTYCGSCHTGPYALEPKKTDITTLATATYATIQAYATAAGNPVCYNGAAYPYWFKDNGFDGTAVPVPPVSDGTCDAAESVSANGAKFDAKGARAAFNYKWSQAEPGAYAHNFEYMAEVLYDTIVDLGGTPPVTPETRLP